MDQRNQNILYAVVEEYILCATPVGSNQIAGSALLHLSSASIRSVMAELEERGFLKRAHASSGRTPTDQGYRFYVDQLMKKRALNSNLKKELQGSLQNRNLDVRDLIKNSCKFISSKSKHASIAMIPRQDEKKLKHIQFFQLKNKMILVVLVSSSGLVENKLLKLSESPGQALLNQMHNYINENYEGFSISEIQNSILEELKINKNKFDDLFAKTLLISSDVFAENSEDFLVEGQSHLCEAPEFASSKEMLQVLKTLEEKTVLLGVLEDCLKNPGVKILIGEEFSCPEVNGLAIVTAPYSDLDGNKGMLGVIGPTRLDYASIVPLVEYTSFAITKTLN